MSGKRSTITTLAVIGLLALGRASQCQSPDAAPDSARPPHHHLNAAAVHEPIKLTADLDQRRLIVHAGDSAIRTFPIAIGSSAWPTPTGSFKIQKIVWNPAWIPPDESWARHKTAEPPGAAQNPMKVAKIFFQEPDYYIHGTGDTESLGAAESHGCIRMDPDDVAELARFLMEHDGQAQEEGWFSRVVHLRWQTHTVVLTHPVSLTIL